MSVTAHVCCLTWATTRSSAEYELRNSTRTGVKPSAHGRLRPVCRNVPREERRLVGGGGLDRQRSTGHTDGVAVEIRPYEERDERGWLLCRLLAFFDTAFYDSVEREKDHYERPAIELVADDGGKIIGLLDLECDSDGLADRPGRRSKHHRTANR